MRWFGDPTISCPEHNWSCWSHRSIPETADNLRGEKDGRSDRFDKAGDPPQWPGQRLALPSEEELHGARPSGTVSAGPPGGHLLQLSGRWWVPICILQINLVDVVWHWKVMPFRCLGKRCSASQLHHMWGLISDVASELELESIVFILKIVVLKSIYYSVETWFWSNQSVEYTWRRWCHAGTLIRMETGNMEQRKWFVDRRFIISSHCLDI